MKKLDWSVHDKTKLLFARGDKGEYWITEAAWFYLERVTPTTTGITLEKLGTFSAITDAAAAANAFEEVEA